MKSACNHATLGEPPVATAIGGSMGACAYLGGVGDGGGGGEAALDDELVVALEERHEAVEEGLEVEADDVAVEVLAKVDHGRRGVRAHARLLLRAHEVQQHLHQLAVVLLLDLGLEVCTRGALAQAVVQCFGAGTGRGWTHPCRPGRWPGRRST